MKTEKQTPENSSAVAIIGMGCFFPGASGLKNYWRLLSRGQDAITEVPETHWSPADYYDADPKKPDHVYCTRGGFLRPVPFDPSEFGIPPTSLEATDTSQLLGLLAAKLALEDAGYGEDRDFARSRTGVILGVTGTQELVIPLGARLGHPHWRRALKAAGISDEKSGEVIRRISDAYVPWQESSFPGLLGNVIAGRISNRLNLQGTNCAVDAACASSMSAMHMALMEIHSGRADMMLTGGVDCLNDIFMHMCFSKTPILSPTGDVRPFSDRADGTLLGEGVGLLIFKRLDLAEADGDRIYAVIKAVGSSSDGKSNSIYAPLAEGQMKALRMAYENAGFAPESVELLEAHGTGTRVGDEVEFRALRQIYTDPSLNLSGNGHQNYCAVGTVKSMIGHTKAAAGAAGLVKNALALYHKVLPPTLKIQTPDPRLNIHDSPFYLNTEKRPWLSGRKHPRRCAVSSFGFGGSNFHMVLEEYQQKKTGPSWDGSVEILALSANSPEELETGLSAWKKEIDQGMTDEELAEKAAQTRLAFSHRTPFRLLMVLEKALDRFENLTEHFSEALESLKTHLKTGAREKAVNIRNIFYGGPESPAKLAFVFPGQGSQYTRMGRDLICCFPEALETLEKADENVKLSRKLSDFIYPLPVFDSREKEKQESALCSTDAAQPGIGALSLAMVKILQRFGIRPDAACGHSFGELSALCAGGKMDEDSFFRLAAERGRLMAEAGKSNAGTMTAVKAPLAEIEKIIREECPDVMLANRNSPDQGVLSASLPAIEKAEKVFHEKGFSTVRLPVSAAFHSSLMAEAGKSFAETVSGISMKSSDIPVFSNADGRPYPEEPEAARKVLGEQLLSPVDFVSEIRNLFESGVRTFVEVGPKSVLSGLIRNILKGFYFQALSLDASAGKRFGIADLAKLLCHLAALGHPVDLKNWENPVPPRRKQRMSIPISGANYRRKSETPPVKTPEKKPKNEQPDIYPNTQPPSPANPSPDLHSAVLRTGGGTFSGRKNTDTASQTAFTAASKDTQTAATADTRTGKQQARPEKKETVPAEPPGQRETVPYKTERNMQNMNRQQNKPTARQPGQNEYIAEAFRAVQEGLRSMQNLHFHTAETHKKFLESQNHAGRTLQQMMDNTRRLAEISIGINGAEGGMKSGVHSGMQQMHYREENRKIPVPEEGNAENESAADSPLHSGQMPHSVQSGETSPPRRAESPSLSPASPKMRHRQENRGISVSAGTSGAVQSPPQTSACPEPVKKPAPAPKKNGRQKVEKTMLDVVSDLTGYPADMLSLDMDIEADLGIDSIKRVEILSRFEEKMPELPPVSPEIMGTLKTLGQIVEYLMGAGIRPGQTGDISPNEPAAKDTSSDTRETVHPPTAADGGKPAADLQKIESVMLEVVSDLTGYPPDMLSLDMDIEADLGIDSIKRVEILSSFEEKMPELPPVSPEIMGTLKTLGQIVDYLRSAGPSAENPSPSLPSSAEPRQGISEKTRENIESVMLEVVSDLTGYPADMLSLDMDIEADLGIDSIKRVEILSSFEEKMPELPPVSPEIMGTLKTLGQIVDYLLRTGTDEGVRPFADASPPSGSDVHAADIPQPEIFSGSAVPADRVKKKIIAFRQLRDFGEAVNIPPGRPVCITEDKKGLAAAIAAEFRAGGTETLLIPSSPEKHAVPDRAAGLILLADAWEEQDERLPKEAFALAKEAAPALLASAQQGGALFAAVSRMDGFFGFSGKGFASPYPAGLAGLVKSASQEWEKVCCHVLDIAPGWNLHSQRAKAVTEELLHRGPVEVGLEPGIRRTTLLEEMPYPEGPVRLRPGDPVIISGGARGVTAAAALALARYVRPTLILLGRSPVPAEEAEWLKGLDREADMKRAVLEHEFSGRKVGPAELETAFRKHMAKREILRNLDKMRAAGSQAVYFSADIRSENAVRTVLDQVRSRYGPVKALIHGAGTLEDRFIADKTREQFDRVFDTKVKGLRVLLEELKEEALSYLILFSSVAARTGNRGQADYAAANEVLNKMAQMEARRRTDCRVISFNWGPWEGGMVSPALQKEFQRRNIGLIPLESGALSMLAEMAGDSTGPVEVVIGAGLHTADVPEGQKNGGTENPSDAKAEENVCTAAESSRTSESSPCFSLKREIDLPRFPILEAHQLDNRPVVPFALMAEWLGHSALHENPGLFFHGLDDFRLLRGISLGKEALDIRLFSAKARRNGKIYEAEVEIRDGFREDSPLIHSKALAVLGDSPPFMPPDYQPSIDISMKSYNRSMSEVYEKILFHGPELQGIQEILNCSPRGMTAWLHPAPAPEKWMKDPLRSLWLSDPLVLDSAFQMAIVWCYEERGMLSLPVYAESYRQYRSCFPADSITAVLEVRETVRNRMKGDFTFLDREGKVIARMKGYEAVMDKSLHRAFFGEKKQE